MRKSYTAHNIVKSTEAYIILYTTFQSDSLNIILFWIAWVTCEEDGELLLGNSRIWRLVIKYFSIELSNHRSLRTAWATTRECFQLYNKVFEIASGYTRNAPEYWQKCATGKFKEGHKSMKLSYQQSSSQSRAEENYHFIISISGSLLDLNLMFTCHLIHDQRLSEVKKMASWVLDFFSFPMLQVRAWTIKRYCSQTIGF